MVYNYTSLNTAFYIDRYFQYRVWLQVTPWWRHQMGPFSALLALCAGNSLVTGEVPSQRPVTRSFGVFFDLRLNKRLSKQSIRRWFETPSRSLWRHCNDCNHLLKCVAEIHITPHNSNGLIHIVWWCYHLCDWFNHVHKATGVIISGSLE